ncbi:MAG TPA: TonB-dependent receptor [Polyangiaceae bacterium]|nr:TonB-dependent receptor [Polyangiaceae bacterium]
MRIRAQRLLSFVVPLSGLFTTASARATDDTGADVQALLDENIVTTASKSLETGTTAPATSTSITAEELRRFGIHSLDEAIDFLSLGVVTANPLRDPDIGSRGVLMTGDRGNHILLLINGHSVNEPLYGSAQFGRGMGVPMEMIDHLEVVIGPGSVLYGSSAMFGVINVITKRAKDFAGTHVIAETEVGKSYRVGAGAGYQLGRQTELTLGIGYYAQKGPTFHFGPQNFGTDDVIGAPIVTTYKGPTTGIWGGDARESYYSYVPSAVVRFSSGNLEVNLRGTTFKRSAPYAAYLSPVPGDFDYHDNYDLDRSVSADIAYRVRPTSLLEIAARLYGDTFDTQRIYTVSARANCIYPGGDTSPCRYHWIGVSQWAGTEVQGSFNWLQDSSLVTMVGADARIVSVQAKQDVQNADTLAYRESSTNVIPHPGSSRFEEVLGAYLQQTWTPSSWLAINAGGRVDASGRYDPVLSPRLAANFAAWQGGTLKIIYAEAFRAPSWNEAQSRNVNLLEADDLRPERVRSVEALLEQKLGAQRVLFGVFRSWWTDLIELHRLTLEEYMRLAAEGKLPSLLSFSAQQYRNVSSIDNFGLNARVEGSFARGKVHYGLNATAAFTSLVDGEFGSSHPPAVTPQMFGNARLAYDFGEGYPVIGLAAHFLGKRPAARAFEKYFTPPYVDPQLQLRLTISGPFPALPGLSYRASVDYAFSGEAPYIVGRPVDNHNLRTSLTPQFAPVDQFRGTVGLQYDFLP